MALLSDVKGTVTKRLKKKESVVGIIHLVTHPLSDADMQHWSICLRAFATVAHVVRIEEVRR